MNVAKLILPVGLLALASVAANAQSIPALSDLNSENPGDLILGFSNAGASKDLLVDVGPASDYYTAQTAVQLGATGFTAPLTGGTTYTVTAYNPTDLASVYGTNANSTSTFWSVVGGNGNDGGPLGTTPNSNLWVSAPLTSTVMRETVTNQQGLSNKLDTITNGLAGGGNAASPGSFASNDAYTPGTKAFTLALTGGNNFGYFSGGQVVGNTGGSSSSLNLFELQPTGLGTAAGVDLGTFTLTSGGLTFTAFTAIPEPSIYAAVLGVLTLGFVLIRRQSKSSGFSEIG